MATCTTQSGFLLWKKVCGGGAVGNCKKCSAYVCERHAATYGDGSFLCTGCGAQVDSDDSTGTVFASSALFSGLAASSQSPAAESVSSDTWHGSDSSGDSGSSSSDSGSSDSGGSSSD